MMAAAHSLKPDRRTMASGARLWLASAFALSLGVQAMAQTPIPPAAADFAMSVAQSDQYEILAAQDAMAQSRDPRIRAFAAQMIDAHSRSGDGLRQAAIASGMTPPPQAMSSEQASMLSALQGQRGVDFDKTYAHQQVLAHTQALAVVQSYASAGKDANLRKTAQSVLPMIQHHLQMAQDISTALGQS